MNTTCMPQSLTPDRLKAALDDLARLSLRYGITISGANGKPFQITASTDDFGGYAAEQSPVGLRAAGYPAGQRQESMTPEYISSLDVSELSNHQKVEIVSGDFGRVF